MKRESVGGARSATENRGESELQTLPKDPSILTFFSTDAYTDPAMNVLGHERRTRGQERRDGL